MLEEDSSESSEFQPKVRCDKPKQHKPKKNPVVVKKDGIERFECRQCLEDQYDPPDEVEDSDQSENSENQL